MSSYRVNGEEPDFIVDADYVTADHHFNHTNILDYSNRPFNSVEEMNSELVESWNSQVGENDTIVIIGDFSLGNHPDNPDDIYDMLNGDKTYVMGDHDFYQGKKETPANAEDSNYWGIIECESEAYLATHFPDNNPQEVPGGNIDPRIEEKLPENIFNEWEGKVIHGHHHNNWNGNNNHDADYPLLHPEKSRANVGVDRTNYAPIDVETLHNMFKFEKRVEKVDSDGFKT